MKTAEEKANKYAEEAILALYSDSELMQDFVQKQKKYAKVDFLAGYNEAMKEVKEMKANAKLIAAAPEMLKVLQDIAEGLYPSTAEEAFIFVDIAKKMANEVIEKALK